MFDETVIKNPFEKVKRKNPLNSKTASSFFCMCNQVESTKIICKLWQFKEVLDASHSCKT